MHKAMPLLIAALFLLVPVAQAQPVIPDGASPGFGVSGAPVFNQYHAPEGTPGAASAGEPTVGIPWNTDTVFFQGGIDTFRIRFPAEAWNGTAPEVVWEEVSPPNVRASLDPMLHADPDLGRVWAGALLGACSVMAYSDDDGDTWIPTGNMCTGAQFDHQTIGSGPHALLPANPAFEHVTYYCAQFSDAACITSYDGGLTWGPVTQVLGNCGGLHGHIRVSPLTGTAVLPDKSCGNQVGFGYTTDDGLTWNSRSVEGSNSAGGFDPSAQFTRDSGWLYIGNADRTGVHIALSKDEGVSWEALGGNQTDAAGNVTEASTWLNVGQFHDPPIKHAHFADVQAGDDDRVALSFLGLEDTGIDYGQFGDCGSAGQGTRVWHYYVALSYDAGQTWDVRKITPDPVQIGSVFTGGFAPGVDSSCRNLLDFNDMDIDSKGRIHVAIADGCIRTCATDGVPDVDGYRTAYATILRQETGRGLFAEFDQEGGPVNETEAPPEPEPEPSNDAPGAGVVLLATMLGAMVFIVRRRS